MKILLKLNKANLSIMIPMYIFMVIIVNVLMVGTSFGYNIHVFCTLNKKGEKEKFFYSATVNSHKITHASQFKRLRTRRSPSSFNAGQPKKIPKFPVNPVKPAYPKITIHPDYPSHETLVYTIFLDYKKNSNSNDQNFKENESHVFYCFRMSQHSYFYAWVTGRILPVVKSKQFLGTENENMKFEWKLNGKLLKRSKRIKFRDDTMIISPLVVSDTGTITCETGNQLYSTNIGVEAMPKLNLEPMFTTVNRTMIIRFDFQYNNNIFNHVNLYINGKLPQQDLLVNSSMDLFVGLDNLPGYPEILSNEATIDYVEADIEGGCPRNDEWGPKKWGQVQKRKCSTEYTGIMKRKCNLNGHWEEVDMEGCQRKSLTNARNNVKEIDYGITGVDADKMMTVSKEVKKLVDEDINDEEEKEMVDMIYSLSDSRSYEEEEVNVMDVPKLKEETETMMGCVGVMLKKFNKKKEKCDKDCSMKLLYTVNVYSNIKSSKLSINTRMPNIRFQRQHLKATAEKDLKRDSPINLLPSFFENKVNQDYYVTTSTIEELAGLLPLQEEESFINSAMVSMDVSDGKNGLDRLERNTSFVHITLKHLNTSMYSPSSCVYWKSDGALKGEWANDGCKVVLQDVTHTVCECNHLTNFALLTSFNDNISEYNKQVLSYISLVGCIISIIVLILTIAYYFFRWRKMKSKRAVLVLNLCGSLIIANLLLLIEYSISDKSQGSCRTLAILLHFFFLVVFFSMLSISVHLLCSVFFVFFVFTKKSITILVVSSWVCACLIVVISMGVTELHGYGENNNCWLSVKDGLLWAFVGPVLLILLFNMAVVVAVLVKIWGMNNPNSEKNHKFKSAVRNVFILNPIMGLTWVFGILSINNQLIAFAYIFTILNSFQGLFIFLLYALLNKANKPKLVKNLNDKKRSTLRPARDKATSSTNDSKNTTDGYSSDQSKSLEELSEHEYVRVAYTRYQPSFKNS